MTMSKLNVWTDNDGNMLMHYYQLHGKNKIFHPSYRLNVVQFIL